MTTRRFVTALGAFTLVAAAAMPALAQSGAKALFYGSSGATLQSNAPQSGPTMSRTPDLPGSNLATGYPSTPGAPAMASPAPAMPPMTPPVASPSPPPSPTIPAATTPSAGGPPPADLTSIVDQLKAATDSLPPPPPAVAASLGAGQGTKDVTAVAGPVMGVKYWVELVDAKGARRQVTTDHVFRAGDRIKLHVSTNRDGHLTLVNVGTTGRTSVLFPSGGASNLVKAGADYPVPPGGYLRFDANPGREVLILTFSPQPGPTSPSAAVAMASGAKDLVTEVDGSSAQPATYAVAPIRAGDDTAGTVAVQITLNHQ